MISLGKLKDHLRGEEGLKLEAYKLPDEKYFTIGYGHYGPDVKKGMKISEEKAEKLLEKDIKDKLKLIDKSLPNFDTYTENLQKFVVDGFFRGDLSGSPKTLKLLKQNKFKEASEEFLNNDEYRKASDTGSGVADRMEDISNAMSREGNIKLYEEEEPRTRRDLPPQAIAPKDRDLTAQALTDEEERIRALNNRKLSDIEARMDQEDMEYLADDKERRPLDVTETTNEDGTTTTEFNVPPPSSERSSLDQQMSDLDFGDLRDAPGSKRIRTAKEEKEQKEKMKKATKEGTRVAGEKPDTTTGFEGEEYTPGVEMESLDDTMIADDTQVSATDMDDTPSGDDIFTTFFKSLGDVTFDEGFEVDDLNLKKGGAVEADFDGKDKDDKDDEDEDEGDPPPLAKPEEVADDIPAMLSEGEYVLPANVVRYLGLERIMDMHKKVLHEIQQMEDLGMIQNVDENGKPENDDDEMKFIQPEGKVTETLIIAAKPQGMMCPPEMAEGGQINRDIDIDRTLDDDILNIRASISNQRNPVGFKTIFDPEVGVIKIKTPKGDISMDKGVIGEFKDQYEGPEGADPADPSTGGTAESGWSLIGSIKDLISETIGGPGTQSDLDDRSMTVGYDVSREVDPGDEDETMSPGHDVGATDDDSAGDDTGPGSDASEGAEAAGAARGGLMAKFNTGGAVDYNIAGVGTVAGDMQLGDQLAAMEKPKTYEEIRADVLGNPLRDVPDLKENYGYTKSENYIYKD